MKFLRSLIAKLFDFAPHAESRLRAIEDHLAKRDGYIPPFRRRLGR